MSKHVLEKQGATWWHTKDFYSPNLGKSSLGEFFHVVLSTGAEIGDIWVFDHRHIRSSVHVSVYMTDDMRKEIERQLPKIKFIPPPEISLN